MSDVRRAQQGDQLAFARLVRAHTAGLFRYVRRMARDDAEADDLVQEAFCKVYEHLARLDPSRPFKPWLYRIATNLAISVARKRKRRRTGALGEVEPTSGAPGPLERVRTADRNERVRDAVDALPPKYRSIVALYYLGEMELREVAEALDMPEGTAKIRLYRARKLLKARLEGLYRDGERTDDGGLKNAC